MDQADWLAARFEEQRAHLRAVAYRMLGSQAEADDAVQNAWLRLSGADTSEVLRGSARNASIFSVDAIPVRYRGQSESIGR